MTWDPADGTDLRAASTGPRFSRRRSSTHRVHTTPEGMPERSAWRRRHLLLLRQRQRQPTETPTIQLSSPFDPYRPPAKGTETVANNPLLTSPARVSAMSLCSVCHSDSTISSLRTKEACNYCCYRALGSVSAKCYWAATMAPGRGCSPQGGRWPMPRMLRPGELCGRLRQMSLSERPKGTPS